MSRPVWIYALVDPRDLKPHYVGRSVSPLTRYGYHCGGSWESQVRGNWIHNIYMDTGQRPLLMLLQKVRADSAVNAEQHWIDQGRKEGWPLVNAQPASVGAVYPKPKRRA